ncbi:hypothetical protein NUACC26_088770 [Scytonema sp. NUACC26]
MFETAPVVFTLGSVTVKTAGDFYTESLEVAKQLGCLAVFLVGDEKLDNLPEWANAWAFSQQKIGKNYGVYRF